ncbi:cell division control 14, SIN component [Rhizodiscina lignyota]|uniref:Cell division control 14, SIN component n=1 Tax=Rhizodiscina lignyota TaxID=1504668 RepID=A0A9P4IM14_9PEZI|nr:cell division control 14, SIN component [Rhizodiscina lignyota]
MESLLSLSFENISSKEPTKIRKGLRQIEGLLAQICLSQTSHPSSPHKRSSSELTMSPSSPQSPKRLGSLNEDPAFREFWRLQEGFEWNVTTRLITTLNTLLGLPSTTAHDTLICSSLTLLQGLLLLHPPSRSLFSTPLSMNLLLDLLDPTSNPPSIQSAALLTLVATLLSSPRNTRTFEKVDGLATVTSLFKNKLASQEVKVKVLEFLYFYLMPETLEDSEDIGVGGSGGSSGSGSGRSNGSADSNGKDKGGSGKSDRSAGAGERDTRTTRQKQTLLGRYLNNVEDLVQDLRESSPFGEVAC